MRTIVTIFTAYLFLIYPSISVAQEDPEYVPENYTEESEKERSGVSLPIRGQAEDHSYFIPSYYNGGRGEDLEAIDEFSEDQTPEEKKNNTSVNVQIGTSFSSDFKGNSAITTYAAPHIRHQISSDLAISGGVIMSQTFLNGWTNYSLDGSSVPPSIYRTTVYGSLEYQLNDRMLLYGTIYQNISTAPDPFGYGNDMNGMGFSAGMDYKISDRAFIQVQVSRSSGYNPFMPSPMRYGFGGSPFSSFP